MIRIWCSAYAWVTGAMAVAAGALSATIFGNVIVTALGDVNFAHPTNLGAVSAVIIATGIAISVSYEVSAVVLIGSSVRVRWAVTAWAVAVVFLACVVVGGIAILSRGQTLATALVCNIALFSGISLATVAIGAVNLAWAGPTLLCATAILLGGLPSQGPAPWAIFLSLDMTRGRVIAAVASLLIGLVCHVVSIGGAIRTQPLRRLKPRFG